MIHIEGYPEELKKPCVLIGNIFNEGVTTYGSAAASGPNAHDGNTFDAWTLASVPAGIVTTLSEAQAVDCLCIAAHNLGTTGSTVEVHYETGAGWVLAASFAATDNGPIMAIWRAQTAVKWRVQFSGGTPPTIGVIAMGKRMVFATGIPGDYVPTNWGSTVEVLGGDTLGGQFLGQRILRRGADTRVTLGAMDREWFEREAVAFVKHYNDANPFFWSGGPRTVPRDLAYCWRPERGAEIRPAYTQAGELVRMSFEVACHVSA